MYYGYYGLIDFKVQLTSNKLGYFTFQICNLDKFGTESEECFSENMLSFISGYDKYPIAGDIVWVNSTLLIPQSLKCSHCVLRWVYRSGNSWGYCDSMRSHGELGCGVQETFATCADIAIF